MLAQNETARKCQTLYIYIKKKKNPHTHEYFIIFLSYLQSSTFSSTLCSRMIQTQNDNLHWCNKSVCKCVTLFEDSNGRVNKGSFSLVVLVPYKQQYT